MSMLNLVKWPVLSLCLLTAGANAELVTLNADSFDVTYDSENVGLFGTPQVSGNSLSFNPVNFSVLSNTQTVNLTNSTVNLIITPHAKSAISAINFEERGDYYLRGETAFVEVAGQLRIRNMDDVFAESTASITSTQAMDQQGRHDWTATAMLDASTGNWKPAATSVMLTIENLLIAGAAPGQLAFLEKKFVGGLLDIQTVSTPLPSALILLLSALGCGGFFTRKGNASMA